MSKKIYCTSVLSILKGNSDMTEFENFYSGVMGSNVLTASEKSMLSVAYYRDKNDFISAANALNGINSSDPNVMQWTQVQTIVNNLILQHRLPQSLSDSEVTILQQADQTHGQNTSVARCLLNAAKGGYDHLFLTPKDPNPAQTPDEFITKGTTTDIFPNPTDGKFQLVYRLDNDAINTQIIITDIVGRRVAVIPSQYQNDELTLDLTGQPQGMYFVTIMNNGKKFSVTKLIKE